MLHQVPSFDMFTNNSSTLAGVVLFNVRDTFNANNLVSFSLLRQHLETTFISFSVGEI